VPPPIKYPELHDVEWLKARDAEGLGSADVAALLGCSRAAVTVALRRHEFTFSQRSAPKWQDGTCETCGRTYPKASGVQRWCSVACRAGMPDLTSICEWCEEPFEESPTGARAKRMDPRRFCSTEHRNLALYGKPSSRYVDGKGYVRITTPDGRHMSEHRYVMEQALGRRLLPGETVHHKDLDHGHNALSNLQLRRGNHGPGAVFQCRSCGSHDIEAVDLAPVSTG
jgi:hypothetical protein